MAETGVEIQQYLVWRKEEGKVRGKQEEQQGAKCNVGWMERSRRVYFTRYGRKMTARMNEAKGKH